MNNVHLIGQAADLISTPTLVVDVAVMEKNMELMKAYISKTDCHIRPHIKTHKSPAIAKMQLRDGAIGLCCATIGEVEAMIEGGLDHLFLVSELVVEDKIRRLMSLAQHADIMVACDDSENLDVLSAAASDRGVTLGVLVNFDVGMGRSGVRSAERGVDLAKRAHGAKGISFRGVFGYEGHAQSVADRKEREKVGRTANARLVEAAEAVRACGIPVEIVTGGGTGTFDIAAEYPGITEIEPGSYIYMDNTYARLNLPFQQSLSVLVSVTSRPDDVTVIMDVGMKGISVERSLPVVKDQQGTIEIQKLSEALAIGQLTDGILDPRPGDKLHLYPSHCCTTVNFYNEIVAIREGVVEAVWSITGRGP